MYKKIVNNKRFYIQSPYERKNSKRLFASAVYPYRCDSLGFPSMMGKISKRLDSSSSYVWDSNSHAHINVTYGGETRRYGGEGNGEGQGISEDKIIRYFTFDEKDVPITLDSIKQLLLDYSKVDMEDDIPHENALTWESVCDTVGNGAWVRLIGDNSKQVTEMKMKCSTDSLAVGKKMSISVTFGSKKISSQKLNWHSSNSNYAEVDYKGNVTAKKTGKGKQWLFP